MPPSFASEIVSSPLVYKRSSSTSLRALSDLPGTPSSIASVSSTSSFSSSGTATSIQFSADDGEVVTMDGLRHVPLKLEARKYKTSTIFLETLFAIITQIGVNSWQAVAIAPSSIHVSKVSGSLTNAVFFVSCPSVPTVRTVLLRIYGSASGALISRPRELHTLFILSSQYRIGPKVFGTFENGRIEEYFDSVALTPAGLRDPVVSRWVGARMAELHSVDIETIEEAQPSNRGEGKGWEVGAKKNVRSWLQPAREVVLLPTVSDAVKAELDLDRFDTEWEGYMSALDAHEKIHGASKRVFCHNDTQYGNLLRLTKLNEGVPEHRRIIVVDFEYASPNPAAFDIGNHFHEWTADYHSDTPHILDPNRYPTLAERHNLYSAYLTHTQTPLATTPSVEQPTPALSSSADVATEMARLEEHVRLWSPASHAMWAVWGLVQAREELESGGEFTDFDYLGYARCRMAAFRREVHALAI